jgi:hypothetical protein
MLTGQNVWRAAMQKVWSSLREERCGRRLRSRRDSSCLPDFCRAAEVVEERQLLSGPAYGNGFSSVFQEGTIAVSPTITTDSAGNAYATINYTGTGNIDPLGPGYTVTDTTSDPGNGGAFLIAKYNPNMTLQWALAPHIVPSGAGTPWLQFTNPVVDRSSSDLFVRVHIQNGSVDLPTVTNSTVTISSPSGSSNFLMRVDANSGNIVWIVSNPNDLGPMGTDASGNLYLSKAGSLAKMNSNGVVQWTEAFDSGIKGLSYDVDPSGNIYVNSTFAGTIDADPSSGVKTLKTPSSTTDILIEKLDTNGRLVWAIQNGTSQEYSVGAAIRVDPNGNIDATAGGQHARSGITSPGFSFGTGKNNITGNFAQFDNNGNLKWLEFVDQSNLGIPPGISSLDSAGNIYVGCTKLNSSGATLWTARLVPMSDETVDAFGNIWFSTNANAADQINVSPTSTPVYLAGSTTQGVLMMVEWTQPGGFAAAAQSTGTTQLLSPSLIVTPGNNTPLPQSQLPALAIGDMPPAVTVPIAAEPDPPPLDLWVGDKRLGMAL